MKWERDKKKQQKMINIKSEDVIAKWFNEDTKKWNWVDKIYSINSWEIVPGLKKMSFHIWKVHQQFPVKNKNWCR
jgi:hypothetical protein